MSKELERKIEEFQKTLDGLKEELKKSSFIDCFEVGKWYKNRFGELGCYESGRCGYGFESNGTWRDSGTAFGFNDATYEWIAATHSEVESALIAEAKKRGFKEGVVFNSPNPQYEFSFNQKLISSSFKLMGNTLSGRSDKNTGSCNIFQDGEWAEIIKEGVIKVGGHEVTKAEKDVINIGCKRFYIGEIKTIRNFMNFHGFCRISFDGVEVDLKTIEGILAL